MSTKRDFFISFNRDDRNWAAWIAWTLEHAGYTVSFQDWDFETGSNFVLKMHDASLNSQSTILVLSDSFLKSNFAAPEWAAAFAQDPTGKERKLVPVRVEKCEPEGLLRSIVYADLVGLPENDARSTLLNAVSRGRRKPRSVAPFPGGAAAIYPPSQSGGSLEPEFPLWVYLTSPHTGAEPEYIEIRSAISATGNARILTPTESKSLERADVAVFLLTNQQLGDRWLLRLSADWQIARQKKIPRRLYAPRELAPSTLSFLNSLTSFIEGEQGGDLAKYADTKSLLRLISADVSQARCGIQQAGDLDLYLVGDHREILLQMRNGKLKRARELCTALLQRRPFSPRGRYNSACILSRLANGDLSDRKRDQLLDEAQESLAIAVKYGFIDFARNVVLGRAQTRQAAIDQILNDPDLKTLFAFRPHLRIFLADDTPTRLLGGADVPPAEGGGYGCIEANMPIDMLDGGTIPLAQLSAGDEVVSWNEERNVVDAGKVRFLRHHIVSELMVINDSIRVTPSHPLLTTEGWRRAVELLRGDQLIRVDGTSAAVESRSILGGKFHVCDLSVSPLRNLSTRGIVTHNDKF
jgi:hypothetical protein